MQQSAQEESSNSQHNIGGQKNEIPKTMNIKIVFQDSFPNVNPNARQTIELIEDFPIAQHLDSSTSHLSLKSLLYEITANYNISLENKQIHFFLEDEELYMNCGVEPISEEIKIHPSDFSLNKDGIRIKAKKMKNIAMLHRLMAVQNPIQNDQEKEKQSQEDGSKSRRTKQRRIGYIIEKVIQWRKLYKGTSIPNTQQSKISLDLAAEQVKISKKSLDDYLFQIRFGHKYHFNFNEHYNDKVGVLRDFVRNKKKLDREEIKRVKLQKSNRNN